MILEFIVIIEVFFVLFAFWEVVQFGTGVGAKFGSDEFELKGHLLSMVV